MDCASFKDSVALFALGALDQHTRTECEAHLREANHDGCMQALESALMAVDSLAQVPQPPARDQVWQAIQGQIGARRLQKTSARWVLAFASILVVALGWLSLEHRSLRQEMSAAQARLAREGEALTSMTFARDACQRKAQQAEADESLRVEAVELLRLPGTALFALAPGKGKTGNANVIIHTGVKRAYVAAEGLTQRTDADYEMWIAHGKRVVSAGLVHVGADGKAIIRIEYSSLFGQDVAPDAMMITLEPLGGSRGEPGPTVLIGATRPG